MMVSRGQAAIEFLSTYGWGILAVMIMVGAIAAFGVTRPQGMLPSRCLFAPELQCREAQLVKDASSGSLVLNFVAINNAGDAAEWRFTNVTYAGTSIQAGCVNEANPAETSFVVRNGGQMEVRCDFSGYADQFVSKDKIKLYVAGTYVKSSGVMEMPISGEIFLELKEI